MEPCEVKTVIKQHSLPRASRRRYKKQHVYVCRDCGNGFYVDLINYYSMDGTYSSYEWVHFGQLNVAANG